MVHAKMNLKCASQKIFIYKIFTKLSQNKTVILEKPHSNRDPTEKGFNGLFLMFILLPVLTMASRQDLQTGSSTMLYLRTVR